MSKLPFSYFGRISEEYCICYADANGNPDGQAGISSRVRNNPIGIVHIKTMTFVTEVSSSIEVISREFAPYLDISAEDIKNLMIKNRELDKTIPNSPAIPFEN